MSPTGNTFGKQSVISGQIIILKDEKKIETRKKELGKNTFCYEQLFVLRVNVGGSNVLHLSEIMFCILRIKIL